LLLKGEKITRNGQFFKIDRYQRKWPKAALCWAVKFYSKICIKQRNSKV
jgi:hypothetical protein